MAKDGPLSKIKHLAEATALILPPIYAVFKWKDEGGAKIAKEVMYGYSGVYPGGAETTGPDPHPYEYAIWDADGLVRLVAPEKARDTRQGMWMWTPIIGVKIGEGALSLAQAAINYVKGLVT